MAAPAGKGLGKGAPPPPPAGKGLSKGAPPPAVAKGLGKGKGPAPGAPVRRPSDGPADLFVPLPQQFCAPAGSARLRTKPLRNPEGTFWEGLDPWGGCNSQVLEGFSVDLEAFQRLWAPMPAPPLPSTAESQPGVYHMPASLTQRLGIAVAATKLTAELVEKAITEDVGAISAHQAAVLASELVPIAQVANAHLQVAVNRHGVTALTRAEQVIWTMGETPMGVARVRLVAEWYRLDEDLAEARQHGSAARTLVEDLGNSKALRTLMQAILAARNILGQQGCMGYSHEGFKDLSHERLPRPMVTQFDPVTGHPVPPNEAWVREHTPSVLFLVAEMLERTHIYRCRLRFLRMLAVGRLLASHEGACRLIWTYLDDLQESPYDVLPLLERCKGVCDCDSAEALTYYKSRLMRLHREELRLVRNLVLPGKFGEQMEVLNNRIQEAITDCQENERMLGAAARRITVLVGETRQHFVADTIYRISGYALESLRVLGWRLTEELHTVRKLHFNRLKENLRELRGCNNEDFSQRRSARAWRPVETLHYCLHVTTDPDLIRGLRGSSRRTPHHAVADGAAEQVFEEVDDAEQEDAPVVNAAPFQDMWHGGPEGRYVRDPFTGAWGKRRDGLDGTTNVELGLGGPRVSA